MPGIKYWDGSAWKSIPLGVPVYEQAGDPGAVPNGSIWIDTDSVAGTEGRPHEVYELVSTGDTTSLGSSYQLVPGLSQTLTLAMGDVVLLDAQAWIRYGGTQAASLPQVFFAIYDGTTWTYRLQGATLYSQAGLANLDGIPASITDRFVAPANGNYTIGVYASNAGSGGGGSVSGSGGRSHMRVVRLGGLYGPIGSPPLLSALPSNPYDGQEFYYVADATSGVIWHLRYRGSSASAYKWEYLGGSPWLAQNMNWEAVSGSVNVWNDAPTPGPLVTLPLAGDYIFDAAANMQSNAVATSLGIGLAFGAAAVSNDDAGYLPYPTANAGYAVQRIGMRRNGLTAGTVVKIKYLASSGSLTVSSRSLRATPVRVG